MSKLKQYKMFINGEWVDSESKKTFETLNPENNKPWAQVPEASANDVDRAVKAAQKAFEGEWPKLLPRERGKYLRAIADKLRDNAEFLGEIETKDTGKLFRETKKQANYIAEYYDYYAGMADKVEGAVPFGIGRVVDVGRRLRLFRLHGFGVHQRDFAVRIRSAVVVQIHDVPPFLDLDA